MPGVKQMQAPMVDLTDETAGPVPDSGEAVETRPVPPRGGGEGREKTPRREERSGSQNDWE